MKRNCVKGDSLLVVHFKDATFDYSHISSPHTMVPERERKREIVKDCILFRHTIISILVQYVFATMSEMLFHNKVLLHTGYNKYIFLSNFRCRDLGCVNTKPHSSVVQPLKWLDRKQVWLHKAVCITHNGYKEFHHKKLCITTVKLTWKCQVYVQS